MSLFSAGFIKDSKSFGLVGDEIQFWEGGYLFLATKERESILQRNTALQQDLGASIKLMSPPPVLDPLHFEPPFCFVPHVSCD